MSMKQNLLTSICPPLFCTLALVIFVGCSGSSAVMEDYDTFPKLREYTLPVFPETTLLSKEKAELLLSLRIDEEGNVRRVAVLKSSGDPQLDSAAVTAAWNWRYSPASKSGKPLPITIEQKVSFATRVAESISFYEIVVDNKDLADSLWALLDAGADFSQLATRFSKAPSAANNGFRENARYDALPEILLITLERLSPGRFSDPIELPNGTFTIVKRKKA
jgi:TonB family protein